MAECGVYRITCTANGRVYIGSSVDMRTRFSGHRGDLRRGRHHSLLLQRAWNKYGEAAFTFEVISLCSPDTRIEIEQQQIDAYHAADPRFGMNRDSVAKGSPPSRAFLGRRHSDATKQLISERRRGQAAWNKGRTSPQKGVPRAPEVIEKIRNTKRARSAANRAPIHG